MQNVLVPSYFGGAQLKQLFNQVLSADDSERPKNYLMGNDTDVLKLRRNVHQKSVVFPQVKVVSAKLQQARALLQHGRTFAQLSCQKEAIQLLRAALQLFGRQDLVGAFMCQLYIFLLQTQKPAGQISPQAQIQFAKDAADFATRVAKQCTVLVCGGLINFACDVLLNVLELLDEQNQQLEFFEVSKQLFSYCQLLGPNFLRSS